MKSRDYWFAALAPGAILLIPLVGVIVSDDWKWTWSDFVVGWALLAGTAFSYRFLLTRGVPSLAYRGGVILAVGAGFLLVWVNLAVGIIGDDNPGNLLYFAVILAGLMGMGLTRFQSSRLARLAFSLAAAVLPIPAISYAIWPTDFAPGLAQVCGLNLIFVGMFAAAGLLFRRVARQSERPAVA